MSTADLHEVVFRWPHSGPTDVIVTGTFDGWSRSIHMPRTPNGFQAAVKVPWGQKVAYKYIVDGRWTTTDGQPTELDAIGNLNNVYIAPARPASVKKEAPPSPPAPQVVQPQPANNHADSIGKVNGVMATAKQTAVEMVEAIAPGTTEQAKESPVQTPAPSTEPAASAPSGAASAMAYVASAVGAVFQSVTGVGATDTETTATNPDNSATVDPAEQLPPTASKGAAAPPPSSDDTTPVPEIRAEAILPHHRPEAEPVAPIVPVAILPLIEPPADEEDSSPSKPEAAVVEVTGPTDSPPAPPAKAIAAHAAVVVEESTVISSTKPEAPPSVVSLPTSEKTQGTTPADIPLPPPTPAEIPLPPTPAVNGNGTEKSATKADVERKAVSASSPSSLRGSPRKEKRMTFPSLGRNHRRSSSSAPSEHGEQAGSPGKESLDRTGSQRKKRTSSFFGKIKELFHEGHHHRHKGEPSESK